MFERRATSPIDPDDPRFRLLPISGGSGDDDPPEEPDDEEPETPADPPDADEGPPEPKPNAKPNRNLPKVFTQDDLNNAAAAAKKAEREANRERQREADLKRQGKYQQIIDSRDREITRLKDSITALQATIDEFASEVDAEFEDVLTNLPAPLRRFAPGLDASIASKRKFLRDAREAQRELEPEGVGTGGLPPSPPRAPGNGHKPRVTPEEEAAYRWAHGGRRL